MISSLQRLSPPEDSLDGVLDAVLPRAAQRLLDSQHLTMSTKSIVEPALRQYTYSFAADSAYRSLFGAFHFPEERSSAAHASEDISESAGAARDDDDSDDDSGSGSSWTLSGAQSKAESSGLSSEYLPSRKGKPCGHVFRKGESVYRCKECGLDDSCVLCAKCFKASDHTGHEVSYSMHSGGCGCCDCGDHEAWRQDVLCAFHHPNVAYPANLVNQADQASQSALPTELQIPVELQDIIRERIREVADAAAFALVQFPRETTAPSDARSVRQIKPRCRPSSGHAFMDYDGPWSVILWNDEKHTYQDVIETLMTSTRCSRERALASAVSVDNHGFEVVASSSDSVKMWDVARRIGSTKLGVTICATEDAVILEALGLYLGWLNDISKARIAGQEGYLGRLVAEVLLSKDRLTTLLRHEEKLWKKARGTLRSILMSLLVVGQDVKLELSRAYASVYPALVSAYLLTDREPDNSVTQFSVQLFSAPSVAAHLVAEHSFIHTIAMLLYAFFTQQEMINTDGSKLLRIPPVQYVGDPIDPELPAFKHKKYYFMLQDLHHLLFHAEVQRHITAEDDGSLKSCMGFLQLFDGMNKQTRASTTHVEYETDSWVAAFNLMIHLSKLAKNAGKVFQVEVAPERFFQTVMDVLAQYKSRIRRLPNGTRNIPMHVVSFNKKQWQTVNFKVSQASVSFHHPVHLMYTEMLKNLHAWTPSVCADVSGDACQNYAAILATLDAEAPNHILAFIDEVVRVLAFLAQIRAGFWVRNGFGVRAQHLHYREYNLRESTFDQDVFFLQAAFLSVDPSLLIVTLLDRFELLPILSPDPEAGYFGFGSVYDPTQATTVLEELLYLLIMVYSEPSDIEALPVEDIVRRELIHVLLLGPYSYSEVQKHVTDRASEETCFDRILSLVATFRAPDPTVVSSDIGGTYVLRDECYPEVDPYYYRYTRNQREQAFKTLKEKLKVNSDPLPRAVNGQGAFADGRFLQSLCLDEMVQLISCALRFATNDPSNYADMVVDLCLQLIRIAQVNVPVAFSEVFAVSRGAEVLCRLEKIEHFKEQHARLASILDSIETHQPGVLGQKREKKTSTQEKDSENSEADVLERKRQAAKARQAAIMQHFAAAQQSFLDSVSDDEDDDEDDQGEQGAMQSDEPLGADDDSDELMIETKQETEGLQKRRKHTSMGSCIVCQEDLNAQRPFGSLALIQTSNFIRLAQAGQQFQEETFEMPRDWDQNAESIRPFGLAGRETTEADGRGGTSVGFPRANRRGLYASACGHMMHISCFNTYCSSIAARHAQQFTRLHPENPERNEFTCPLCKSLGNVLLPISEDEFEENVPPPGPNGGVNDTWLEDAINSVSSQNADLDEALSLLTSDGKGRLKAWRIVPRLPQSTVADTTAIMQTERKMLERFMTVISPLEAENSMMAPRSSTPQAPSIARQLIGYTLAVAEIGLRGKETGTLCGSSLPDATSKLLRSLLSALSRLAQFGSRPYRGRETARTALLWLMFGQRRDDFLHFLPFLDQDPLDYLVQMAAISPDDFYQIANLTFYATILRTSHQVSTSASLATIMPAKPPADDASCLAELSLMLQEARWSRSGAYVSDAERQRASIGAQHVYQHVLPFLRRAALLHGTIFPDYKPSPASGDVSEMSRLLQVLRIAHPSELVSRRHGKAVHKMNSIASIMDSWDAAWLAKAEGVSPVELEHSVIYELLGLPRSIDSLVESTVTRKCKRCKTVPSDPAICLVCGELVCQQSYCCMDQDLGTEPTHGECNTHMWQCGSSTGIYIMIKRCVIVYLYADKGTFGTAPYLDVHGEADPGFRKHRPLYLNKARYDEVRKLWLNHSVATLVARKLESGNDPGGWNTF